MAVDRLRSWLEPHFQLAEPFYDECLGIEVHRIARVASHAVDIFKERQCILFKGEDMESPSAFGIRFLIIDEPMVMLV